MTVAGADVFELGLRLRELEELERRYLLIQRVAIEEGAYGTPGLDRDLEEIRREAGTIRAELEARSS